MAAPTRTLRSRLSGLGIYFSRDFLRYLGPGFIVTVGFVDPGNWATNVAVHRHRHRRTARWTP